MLYEGQVKTCAVVRNQKIVFRKLINDAVKVDPAHKHLCLLTVVDPDDCHASIVQRKTSRLYVHKGNSVLKIAIWMQS